MSMADFGESQTGKCVLRAKVTSHDVPDLANVRKSPVPHPAHATVVSSKL